jgi:hypothetical protein
MPELAATLGGGRELGPDFVDVPHTRLNAGRSADIS